MKNKTIKHKAIMGFFWTLAEKFAAQGVSFVVSIILARLLTPDDYGIVAIITIFTSIANVFVKSGLGSALIQKKDADELDFSTVFIFNVLFSVGMYILIFLAAPWIGKYYKMPNLVPVLRVSAISLIINGINNVQQAYVSKKLKFKLFFYSTLVGTILSAIVGIIMAYSGFGVWALVTQQLLNSTVDTVILHFTIGWKPTRSFSFTRLKSMYSFGWKLLVSDLTTSVYTNLQGFVIGMKYSSEQLAYNNKGLQFPQILARNIDNSIQSVTFPVLSHVQDDKERFRALMYRGCSLSFYFICPMMIGMMCIARPMVVCLLTEKWIKVVPYLQLYCMTFLLRPIEATNLQALYALGRSDITLKLDVVKKAIGIMLLFLAIILFDDPVAICVTSVIGTIVATILNMVMIERLIQYKTSQQIMSMLPTLILSSVMGGGCIWIQNVLKFTSSVEELISQIVIGIFIYLVLSLIFKPKPFCYLLNYLKRYVLDRKKCS